MNSPQSRSQRSFALVLIAVFLVTDLAQAQCDSWVPGPQLEFPGISGEVHAVASWDPDGSGPLPPQLVIGGSFTTAGGVTVNGIARWDGTAWQPFSTGMSGHTTHSPYAVVNSLAVLPASFGTMAGQLVAAGDFDTAGGVSVQGFARWDGAAWQAIPGWSNFFAPVGDPYVNVVAVAPAGADFAGKLLLGGNAVALYSHLFIVTWDGAAVSSFGLGGDLYDTTHNEVNAITFWDPDGPGPAHQQLVLGGHFGRSSTTLHNIAMYSASDGNWIPFANGLGPGDVQAVSALAVIPSGAQAGQLIAGGAFGLGPSVGVARWDGSAWQAMGGGLGNVSSFTTWDPDGSGATPAQIVAGGSFNSSGGTAISPGIARWDGAGWRSIGAGVGSCKCVSTFNPNGTTQLIAAGFQLQAGANTLGSVASLSSSAPAWIPFPSPGSGQVYAFAQLGTRMVGAGSFSSASGAAPHNIAVWNGDDDEPLGSGFNNTVLALKSYTTGIGLSQQNHLIAGGQFTTAGGAAAFRVAIWSENPTTANPPPVWTAMGNGFNGNVYAIERFNNVTFAAGDFTANQSNTTALGRIASFNGTTWAQPGAGLNGTCYALKTYNGQLYAGGSFTTAGGLSSGGLARWNGTTWSIVGGNFAGIVLALEVYNGELIIAGQYPGITGNPNIAKYNSATGLYSTLGSGGTDNFVYSLVSEGGNLYAGGLFTHAGGVPVPHLARWNGSAWSDVRVGTDGAVYALAGYHNEVQVGGAFSNVGIGVASPGWARYLETGAPWIAAPPFPTVAQCSENAFFTATPADGYTLQSVTWRRNGTPLANGPTATGSFIAGADGPALGIFNAGVLDQASYDAVLTSACGNITSPAATLTVYGCCGSADFNCDGDIGTDADIEAFFACLSGQCPAFPCPNSADFNDDGDTGTDLDIEAFFRVLAGGTC